MTRLIDFRYRLLKNGADFGWLAIAGSNAPRIRVNSYTALKSRFSGSFLTPAEGSLLDLEIMPEIIIDEVSYPLGVFVPTTVEEERTGNRTVLNITGYDRCWTLKTRTLEHQTTFTAGQNYLDPIKYLLAQSGITLIVETPTTAILSNDRADWTIGTDYLTIINNLLSEINYEELWFNGSGAAVLSPKKTPNADNINYTFDADNINNLVLPMLSKKTDIYSTPNVFIVVCSNPDKSDVMIAKAENLNPQSPLSIPRRGRRITSVISVDNTANQAELQAFANRMRDDSLFQSELITVQTALFPGFGVNDIIALHYEDIFALCRETEWTMALQVGGTMTHTLERMVLALG